MKQYTYKNTNIYLEEGKISQLRLLQSSNGKAYPLSQFFSNEGEVLCAINASFFHLERDGNYVLGRCQGDEYQATYNDQESGHWCDAVTQDDGIHVGKFHNWEYTKSKCGYSPVAILIKDGVDVEEYSTPLNSNGILSDNCDYPANSTVESIIASKHPRTALVITKDDRAVFVKNDGRNSASQGLTGFELREFLKTLYDIKHLCMNDGGGSAEFIYKKKIYGNLSDGGERPMLDALVMILVNDPEDEKDKKIKELEAKIEDDKRRFQEIANIASNQLRGE